MQEKRRIGCIEAARRIPFVAREQLPQQARVGRQLDQIGRHLGQGLARFALIQAFRA